MLKINKIKFEPYGDLVDQAHSKFYETLINNKDSHNQIENFKTQGEEYPNKVDKEITERDKTSAISNFIPKTLSDDEIEEGINFLNSNQSELFNVQPRTKYCRQIHEIK